MRYVLAVLLSVTAALAQWPDPGGYRVLDSDTTAGPAFQWVDIVGTGTAIVLGDDDNSGPLALGFPFRFYGETHDSVYVCSNGWVSFTSSSHQFHHYPIPDTRDPNALAAPLWMDLDPAQGGAVYYLADTANCRFIVSWEGVPIHDSADCCTFQAVLDSSGDVLFQYNVLPLEMRVGGYDFTVGMEDDSGRVGYEYQYDNLHADTRLHDSLALRFYQVERDAAAVTIVRPVMFPLAGDSIVPLIEVWNAGTQPATFPVTLRIDPGYEQHVVLTDLPALADTLVPFPVWVPGEGEYWLSAFTSLAGDEFPSNDSARSRAEAAYTGQMYFDDGDADTWFLRNGSPSSDWAGAVKFSPPYAGYRLRRLMIGLLDSQPLARVLVCPDSGGAPKVSAPFFSAESVRANRSDMWLELSLDTAVSTGDDIWLVAFWPRRATGPAIGEDRDRPIDGRSYYGSPTVRWIAYAGGDLLMRLEIDGRTGIAEAGPSGTHRGIFAGPNPARGTISLAGETAEFRVFDVNGRLVRRLAAEQGRAAWDGRDETGNRVKAGAYFVRARIDASSRCVKVLLTQ
jgi:hypothetical protein